MHKPPLVRLETEEALVPHVWHVEVRSALLAAQRRRRLGPDEVDDCLRRVRELPVRTDAAPDIETAFALAREHRLSLDDAPTWSWPCVSMRRWPPWTMRFRRPPLAKRFR